MQHQFFTMPGTSPGQTCPHPQVDRLRHMVLNENFHLKIEREPCLIFRKRPFQRRRAKKWDEVYR